MSFILDALRKSERERQRSQEPGVAELWTQGKRASKTFWIPLVMLLIGLNLSLLIFLWLKGNPEPAAESTAASADTNIAVTVPGPVSPGPVIAGGQPDRPTRRLSAEIPAELMTNAPAPDVARPPPVSPPADTGNSDRYKNLPSLMELTLAGTIELQPLRLDIHVYSDQPAERFVFINMKKYREGDPLIEGPVLEAITREGVVLAYQGRSFIATRE